MNNKIYIAHEKEAIAGKFSAENFSWKEVKLLMTV